MFSVLLLAQIGWLISTSAFVFAHDPAETARPTKLHVHITGRVMYGGGRGIEGAWVGMERGALLGLPDGCWLGAVYPVRETRRDGSYEVIVFIDVTPECRDAFDRISVDRNRVRILKELHRFRPR
jgi:hypothetical protein